MKLLRKKLPQLLCLAVFAGPQLSLAAGSAPGDDLETVSITATRNPQILKDLPASLSVVDGEAVRLVAPVHISEVTNRIPGVWVTRGNGQEHLTAIRSPVLTGAGSCGAFAISEEGIPVRATGFCNVNQLFDLNTEQAQRIEVLRGPGTVLYGSDAQHGVINIVTPAPTDAAETRIGLESGANDYARIRFSHGNSLGAHGLRIDFNGASDGGYRDDSGFDQQKLTARHDFRGERLNVRSLLSLSNLNQETAGYVSGEDVYKDAGRKRENPNPEAFRDTRSARLQSRIDLALSETAALQVTPYARFTDMAFLMHFLPGTPLEENGQRSFGFQSAYFAGLDAALDLTAGIDAEITDAWLKQSQQGGFSSFPAGRHYDYSVQALMAAAFASLDYQLTPETALSGGLRYETLEYDYKNRMISGNTAEDGSQCINGFTGAVGCRYTRPDDSLDRFGNLSVNLGLVHNYAENHGLFLRLARGGRAPQATEMYRLQNGQMAADLDSESVQSAEFGLRGQYASLGYSVAAFYMEKDDVIFQSADRLYLSDGETDHQGLEYQLDWQLDGAWSLGLSGTLARHRYLADVSVPGVAETIATRGNDVVSAPRRQHALHLGWNPGADTSAELEWLLMGRYYTDLENAHEYPGHRLWNLRLRHQLNPALAFGLRIKNLIDIDYAERADFSAFGGERYFIGEPRSLYVDMTLTF